MSSMYAQPLQSVFVSFSDKSDIFSHEGIVECMYIDNEKLALWRYDYNNVRPHSSLGNQTPAEARRALAQNDDEEYEIQTRKLSL